MSQHILDPNSGEIKTIREIVRRITPHMQCNCDLDSWQPEQSTGHSHVCRIHRLAEEIALILLRKGMSRRIKELKAEKERRERVIEELAAACKAYIAFGDYELTSTITEEKIREYREHMGKESDIRLQMQEAIAKEAEA